MNKLTQKNFFRIHNEYQKKKKIKEPVVESRSLVFYIWVKITCRIELGKNWLDFKKEEENPGKRGKSSSQNSGWEEVS